METSQRLMPPRFHLVLVIHAHQPSGNFEHVFERCYQTSYLPFIDLLEKYSSVRLGLHYSGSLLSWFNANHPEYISRLKKLVASGQIELLGGGFYEPILVSIPPEDQREQLLRLADFVETHFGKRPGGAWLAERVWEPQLPSVLAESGVAYTIVDDVHFLSAGFAAEDLFGTYVAEDRGKCVRLFPGHKALRYLVPFGKVEDVIVYLKTAAFRHPGGLAAMGDDMEKFGVWPGTFQHCYTDGWLKEFFAALQENSSWLTVCTPSEYREHHAPLGRADLPAASYTEMMEWVLPTNARQRLTALQHEFAARHEVLAFLRGRPWRAFLPKYPEANLLNKKMLRACARVAAVPARRSGSAPAQELIQARDFLLRAQSNDAYWHGVFGGIYAPHLRTELWRNLIRAEIIADRLTPAGNLPRVEIMDYDADGASELDFNAPEYHALLKPADGGTMAMLDFRPCAATLINSMQRRPEAYHARLREASRAAAGSAISIHDQTRVKEPGLERFLRYDRWPRHAFRVLIFDPARTQSDYEMLQLQEHPDFAGGEYVVRSSAPHHAELLRKGNLDSGLEAADAGQSLTKYFSFSPAPRGCEVACKITLKLKQPLARNFAIGIESIINFLAPAEPDRFFETPAGPQNLRFSGVLAGPILLMQDQWQGVRISLHAPSSQEFWIAPIETVSESEEGFERVYQGSQILAVWRPELTTQKSFTARLIWRVETLE